MNKKEKLSTIFKLAAPALLAGGLVGSDNMSQARPPSHSTHEWSVDASPIRLLLANTKDDSARAKLVETFRAQCVSPKKPSGFLEQSGNVYVRLDAGGTLAKKLYSFAKTYDIVSCPTDVAHAERSYDNTYHMVFTANHVTDAKITQTAQTAHGLMHAYMQQSGRLQDHPREILFSRLTRQLTIEAIANVSEFTVAAEMAATGDSAALELINQPENAYGVYFNRILKQQAKNGVSGARAIENAAAITVNMMVRDPAFISHQSNQTFLDYIDEAMSFRTASAPQSKYEFTANDALALGRVTDDYNLARGVRPLTRSELAQLSPVTAQTATTLEALRARKFGYSAPDGLIAQSIPVKLEIGQVDAQLRLSQGIYTAHQAIVRAQNANLRNYSIRADNIAVLFARGIQTDYTPDQLPAGTQSLWDNMQTMRIKSPTLGRAFFEYSMRANVFVCAGPLPHNIAAQWNGGVGGLRVRSDLVGKPISVSLQGHEMMHAVQDNYKLAPYSRTRNIWDRQMMMLNTEAAAKAVESLIALEYAYQGDAAPAEHLMNSNIYKRTKEVFDQSLADGATYNDALSAAGLAGWNDTFKMQWWLNSYNGIALKAHILFVQSSRVDVPDATSTLDLSAMRMSGQVSPTFSFTKGIGELPAQDTRFGSNAHMRQAFDYVNIVQLKRTLGANSARTRAAVAAAAADHNPYLATDLDKVAHMLATPAYEDMSPLQVMNIAAGLEKEPAAPPAQAQKTPQTQSTEKKPDASKPFCV